MSSATPSPQSAEDHSRDPRRIGTYRIVGRMARDDGPAVYVGRTKEKRHVAIWTVPAGQPVTAELRSQLDHRLNLVRATSAICLVPLLDSDPSAERPWYTTPLVSGPTLADDVATHGALNQNQVRMLALGLAEAIDACHTAGWTLSGLTAAQVVLAPAGPALLDPVLTRLLSGGSTTQSPGVQSESGEAATAEPGHADTAADIHTWATLVAFAATGHTSTRASTADALDPELREVLAQALSDDPQARPDAVTLFRHVAQAVVAPEEVGTADAFVARAIERHWTAPSSTAATSWTPLDPRKQNSSRVLRPRVAIAGLLALVAGLAAVYALGGLRFGADPTDPEHNAGLIEEAGCENCDTPVHVVPGLEHQGSAARLVLTNADTQANEHGGSRQVAAYLIRNHDDEIVAHNMAGDPSGVVISPDLEFDDLWEIDSAGNFYLLTGGPGDGETQRVAWLNQNNPDSVENFSTYGVQTAWQDSLEATDLDGDGVFEVAADAGVRTYPPESTNARVYHKYDEESGTFQPWQCTETQGGNVTADALAPMNEEPCTDYGHQEDLPWDY